VECTVFKPKPKQQKVQLVTLVVVQVTMDMSLPLTPVAFSPSVPKYGTLIPNRIFVGGIANDVCYLLNIISDLFVALVQ